MAEYLRELYKSMYNWTQVCDRIQLVITCVFILMKLCTYNINSLWKFFNLNIFFFKKLGFTPCKVEQLLQGMELKKKKCKKIEAYKKSV